MAVRNAERTCAVLFVLIGWAKRYDGTELIVGNHRYLKEHPEDNSEVQAFAPWDDGYYYCGAGRGELHEKNLDVVFVARHEETGGYYVVGLYQGVEGVKQGTWMLVRARSVVFFPVGKRRRIDGWIAGQNMRRWAHRISQRGRTYDDLYDVYKKIRTSQISRRELEREDDDFTDPELGAFEGAMRRRFIAHRQREGKLRTAKIRQALASGGGNLRCEVPHCGFDFSRVYGEIGHRFAVVHHRKPLASAGSRGARTTLEDLAVVCANCHAMIHRGGDCRPLDGLIPKKR